LLVAIPGGLLAGAGPGVPIASVSGSVLVLLAFVSLLVAAGAVELSRRHRTAASRAAAALAGEREARALREEVLAALLLEVRQDLSEITRLAGRLEDAGGAAITPEAARIHRISTRLTNLGQDSITALRIESGRVAPTIDRILLAEELTVALRSAPTGDIRVCSSGVAAEVRADRQRLRHALRNLLTRACSEATSEVRIVTVTNDAEVRVTIADDGPPLDPDVAQTLSRPPHLRPQVVGTVDLPLEVARSLIESAGGCLGYVRTLGWSNLVVTLPGRPVPAAVPPATPSEDHATIPPPLASSAPAEILTVERG